MTIRFVNVLRDAIDFSRVPKKRLAEEAGLTAVSLHNMLSGRTRRPRMYTARVLALAMIRLLQEEAQYNNSGKCRTLIARLRNAYEEEYGKPL